MAQSGQGMGTAQPGTGTPPENAQGLYTPGRMAVWQ